jgi:hypothetical protein
MAKKAAPAPPPKKKDNDKKPGPGSGPRKSVDKRDDKKKDSKFGHKVVKDKKPKKTIVNPELGGIPEEAVEEFVIEEIDEWAEDDGYGEGFAGESDTVEFVYGDVWAVDGTSGGMPLDAPTSFVVISQKIRRAPGGQQVIDIIVQVDDVIGASEYEFQVDKI